jgi:hypothetical protein
MVTYWQIWGGTASITISSLRLMVLGVGFFCITRNMKVQGRKAYTNRAELNSYLEEAHLLHAFVRTVDLSRCMGNMTPRLKGYE